MFTPTRTTTWRDVVQLSDGELARLDIAYVHLLCAEGLPFTAFLNIPLILDWIDRMTEAVRQLTASLYPDLASLPEEFRRSEAVFRMACLISVVRRDFHIRTEQNYFPANRHTWKPVFVDSREIFLHGLFEGRPGTCANLPVLYAAIARRLGYPLYLVRTAAHLFARWQGADGERFNVECTSPGLHCPSDEYYLSWPFPVEPWEWYSGGWLLNNTPRQELSGFLLMRAACLSDNGHRDAALEAVYSACELAPNNYLHRQCAQRMAYKTQEAAKTWHPSDSRYGGPRQDPYRYGY